MGQEPLNVRGCEGSPELFRAASTAGVSLAIATRKARADDGVPHQELHGLGGRLKGLGDAPAREANDRVGMF